MNSCITTYSTHPTPKPTVASPRLLAVGERKRSGLILCKQHYAEFAGPGAAICNPFEADYTKIIAIGSPEIIEVATYDERQQAYGRRIQWVRWLQRIVSEPEANQRAEKLFAGFEEFFGSEVLVGIPNDVLALLAGVLPHTITLLRSQHQDIERGEGHGCPLSLDWLDVKVITLDSQPETSDHTQTTSPGYNYFSTTFSSLPCSA
ncbi:MAG: hypothetical protein NW224_23040 [Leptolyngbyaceae cyanobacterium bins.302]|nr:hypothetical protein [Leptolyngbyaceae cyanobacterium bins.302]